MKFVYDTGLKRKLFHNVRLWGSWDSSGRYSDEWTEAPMKERVAGDGGVVFEAEISLQPSEVGKQFSWSVIIDGPLGLDRQGITTEAPGAGHDALHRTFELQADTTEQRYYLTHIRRLGARKVRVSDNGEFALRFAVWAPNARRVSVVGDFNGWDGRRHAMRLRHAEIGRAHV